MGNHKGAGQPQGIATAFVWALIFSIRLFQHLYAKKIAQTS